MASASVTFHDVTACFSEKQWQLLEEWQKQLYRSAMKEIHGTLISLGYMIVNPDVVFRIEKEEPYFRSCHDFEGQESIITHTSGSSANPDIVFRIEKKKELCFSDRYDTNTTATGSSVLNPDIFIRYRSNNKDPEERERVTLPTTKDGPMNKNMREMFSEDYIGIMQLHGTPTGNPKENVLQYPDKGKPYKGQHKSKRNLINPLKYSLEESIECVKGFGKLPNYIMQQRTQLRKGQNICAACEKSFSAKSELLRHQRIHTGEKPYKCMQCEKSFSDKSHLRRHQRIHTGEKRYKCTECEKRFSENACLVKHLRTHTGERPYKCNECEKCFTQSSNLITHKRIHTGNRPYICTKCDKQFFDRSCFKIHQRTHTKEKSSKDTPLEKPLPTTVTSYEL
ncbi:zinc finger protein 84-like isoform X2 [Rhinatrema bivittatum]|uniref:zinc finger protein 84-like isoform X2 n=1 Tax=Rhinatrema bivittatum TaxID=194408 RepID=UPI00112DEF21|nr:zinc finger protein 84-like isoform X2 [Rhinatrema bivittatum]